MNDIIRMAREAGLERDGYWEFDMQRLERFAALVAAAEREECAKVCDDAAIKLLCGKSRVNQIDRHTAEVLRGKAATIRARKES